MTPDRARDIITRRLHSGERLIWHDAPNPWRISLLYMFFIPGSYAISGNLLREAYTSLGRDGFSSSAGLRLAIGCLGLFYLLLVLRKIINAWRTAYGLTDKRVIVAIGGKTESYSPAALEWMNRGGSGKRGAVRLGKPYCVSQPEFLLWQILKNPNGFVWHSLWRAGPFDKPGLYGIREPARVEALISKTLLKPHTEGAPA